MNNNAENKKKVIVIGHRNPDTDSICSAIAYAELKNRTVGPWHEPCRTGELNRETQFVLERFGMKPPRVCPDVYAEVQDIDIRPVKGVPADTSMRRAWELMRDMEAKTQPIVTEDGTLLGISTLGDLAKANMDSLDPYTVSAAHTPYENIISVLNATVVCGDLSGRFEKGKVIVGAASPEKMETKIDPGDIVIVANRYETQLCAIEMGAALIVVCMGQEVAGIIRRLAEENGCAMITTAYDSFAASNLILQSVPISAHMTPASELLKFLPTEPVEHVREVMSSVRHRYFPICSTTGKYMGLISRRNLLNLQRKQLILVDHNEKSQCVAGWEDAEILEIIDHHRIGNLQTTGPIYFTNRPVGCTSTIVYQLYNEAGEEIPPEIAGIMLSAILSDTLLFLSPTCTPADKAAAKELAKIAGVDPNEFASEMFEAAEDLTGLTAESVFFADFKEFSQGESTLGVGQGSFLSEQNLEKAKELLTAYAPEAREKAGVDMIFYMLTSIRDQSSVLICSGEDVEELVQEAYGVEVKDGAAYLPGVISRKKQLIPALLNTLRKM